MADFLISYKLTNHNEAGYANNPNDKGGETYAGIARNFWPNWPGWKLIDQYKEAHGIIGINKAMAESQFMPSYVQEFYRNNFWNPLCLTLVKDQQVANAAYDMGVNSGTGISARLLQQACSKCGHLLSIDGKIGPATLTTTNSISPSLLLTNFNQLRKDYYNHIVERDPSQKEFLTGWLNRIKEYAA